MILFTTFFATLALLFKSLLATVGILMATTIFLACVIAFVTSAIESLFQPQQ